MKLLNIKNFIKKTGKIFLFFWFFIFILNFKNAFALEIPLLNNYVTDNTGTLTNEEKKLLEQKLSNYDKETSNQIVVLIISSLNEETYIEDYSMQVAMKNKIGTAEKDNGILFLVIKEDHELRIEVGYGLEGFLTDAKSSYIIRNNITPYFKEEKYFLGIDSGVNEIIKACNDAEYLNEEVKQDEAIAIIFSLIVFIFIILLIILSIKSPKFRKAVIYSSFISSGNRSSGNHSGGFSGGGFHGGGGSFGGGGSSGKW